MKIFLKISNSSAWWLTGLGLLAGLACAIRPESLWIDELSSAWLAAQSTWGGLISQLQHLGSEVQMPLHVVWIWGWGQIWGISECALRASNLPWAVLLVCAWLALIRRQGFGLWAAPLLLSPFVCFYMNEARPYIMTLASAMMALLGTEMLCCAHGEQDRKVIGRVLLVAGVGICLGASMLNMILLPALLVYFLLRSGPWTGEVWRRVVKGNRGVGVALGLIGLGSAVYYGLTLMQGHGGQREPYSWVNAGYACYEMLGFGGVGVPRILCREMGIREILSQYGAGLCAGVVVWGLLMGSVLCAWRGWVKDRDFWTAWAAFGVGVASLIGLALVGRASLWGRHFMAVYPFFLLGLVIFMGRLKHYFPRWGKWVIFLFIGLFLLSSGRQRLMECYKKDPLRDGLCRLAEISGKSQPVPVLALIYPPALWYYKDVAGDIQLAGSWSDEQMDNWCRRNPHYYILTHRSDKTDPSGVWVKTLRRSQAQILWMSGNVKIIEVNGRKDSRE
jgi:hypothetical protein